MIRGVYLNGMTEDCSECFNLRKTVFDDELHYEIFTDQDDETALQLLLYGPADQPVGSVRLVFDLDGMFQFDYLCVLPEFRSNGYGDFLMHMLFDKARLCGADYLVSEDLKCYDAYFKKYGFKIEKDRMVLDIKEYFNSHKCCH